MPALPLLVLGIAAARADLQSLPLRGVHGQVHLPYVGLGTWLYDNAKTEEATAKALRSGYRHIDTAYIYENQAGVGKALAASGLPREEVFLTSKIPGGLNYTATTAALETCLAQLATPYVDLMLIHFPATMANPPVGSPSTRQQQWLALEAFAKAGKARAIGVSHYCASHLRDTLAVATLPIAINQVEYHVGMGSAGHLANDDKAFMDGIGTKFQSFSPLCGPCGTTELLNGTLVTRIGAKYGKTGAQVALKWLTQQGIPVIPKSSNVTHQQENLDMFSWELSQADMAALTLATSPPATGGPNGTSGDCSIGLQETLYA